MRVELLNDLQCPYSGSELTLARTVQGGDGRVRFGLVRGEAGAFPVVDGILRLQCDERRAPLVEAIERGRLAQAAALATDYPYHTALTGAAALAELACLKSGRLAPVARAIGGLKRRLRRSLAAPADSFCRFLDRLPSPEHWREWQKFRFSMATFLPVYPLLAALDTRGRVLDCACGLGHASFLLSRAMDPRDIVCADYSFSSLCIARKFFVPEANFVCLDGNMLLPFKSGTFSGALCSDAFHFIHQKQSLARELRRAVAPHGTVVLAHLHSALSPFRSGTALTPAGYRRLFADVHVRVVPERPLIEAFLEHGVMDLETEPSEAALNASTDGVSLVASADAAVLRRYHGLLDSLLARARNPVINPIYRRDRHGGAVVLNKRVSRGYQAHIESRIKNYAVDAYRLDESEVAQVHAPRPTGQRAPLSAELFRRFVLIDVPESYPSPGG